MLGFLPLMVSLSNHAYSVPLWWILLQARITLVRLHLLCDNGRMIILLSNDDGIQSEGLTALEKSLAQLGEIYTVAPDRAQSSMSHA